MTPEPTPVDHGARITAAARLAGLALLLAVSGCASSLAPTVPAAAPVSPGAPSHATTLICTDDAEQDIAGALGETPKVPLQPTWKQQTYSCEYDFTGATMLLSVKQLPDAATTVSYFGSLRGASGSTTTISGMGDAAFMKPGNSVVLRKDEEVLTVDVSDLPATFGKPSRSRADVAKTVATTVLICWKED